MRLDDAVRTGIAAAPAAVLGQSSEDDLTESVFRQFSADAGALDDDVEGLTLLGISESAVTKRLEFACDRVCLSCRLELVAHWARAGR